MEPTRRFFVGVATLVILAGLTGQASAQRAAVTAHTPSGVEANVLYQQSFDERMVIDNFTENAEWCSDPIGAFGSEGSLKISGDRPGTGAERYMKWTDDDTTIMFMYYAHGAKSAYALAHGEKAGKNLHVYFPIKQQDQWQLARVKASSLVGFGGGASSPGEIFKNLVFYVEEWDKLVDKPYLLIDSIVIFSGEDGIVPTAPPTAVKVNWYADKGVASINWQPAKDAVGVYTYTIHRSQDADFTPSRNTRIGWINDTYFEDATVAAGNTYTYRVVAEDAGGNAVPSDPVTYTSQHDASVKTGDTAAEQPAVEF